jgi:hypothetical protein
MPLTFVTVASRRFKFGYPPQRATVMHLRAPLGHYRLRPRGFFLNEVARWPFQLNHFQFHPQTICEPEGVATR